MQKEQSLQSMTLKKGQKPMEYPPVKEWIFIDGGTVPLGTESQPDTSEKEASTSSGQK